MLEHHQLIVFSVKYESLTKNMNLVVTHNAKDFTIRNQSSDE